MKKKLSNVIFLAWFLNSTTTIDSAYGIFFDFKDENLVTVVFIAVIPFQINWLGPFLWVFTPLQKYGTAKNVVT